MTLQQTRPERSRWKRWLPWALASGLLFSFISVSVAQIFMSVAFALWIIGLIRDKRKITFPSYFWPLIVYSGLSLLSSACGLSPATSFKDCKELLLFLIIPITCAALDKTPALQKTTLAVLASGAVSIVYSIVYYFTKAQAGERIAGFMGHYMTQSGLLVLFCCLALGLLFFGRDKLRWSLVPGLGLAAFCLVLTLTRSAWIGFGAALAVILILYKPKLLVILPVAAVMIFFLSPRSVKNRALSIFSAKSYSNSQRIEYFKAGLMIIREHPWLGTGPRTVWAVFQDPKYGLSEEARRNVHLHSNLTQIAAERGLPALAAWLVFVGLAAVSFMKLLRQKEGDPDRIPHAAAALAALVSLFISGVFEYNFSDSEITMLFLYLISVPFASLWTRPHDPARKSE